MSRTFRDLIILALFSLISTFLIWLPHILSLQNFWGLNFKEGFATIYRNFDGLEYVVIAKTFYNPDLIGQIPMSLPANYYASHFPGYSIFILLLSPIFGFLKSMLLSSIVFTIAATIAFYYLVRDFKITKNPLILSLIFLILPSRWMIVRSVGSAEPMFIFFVIASLYFFLKYESSNKLIFVLLTSFFGLFAQLTRPPGVLLFIALLIYVLWKILTNKIMLSKALSSYYPLLLIPLGLLSIFYWYQLTYNDFLAYFHSGDNIHLTLPPFQIFNKNQFWVGEIWLEDIIYIFLLGILGGLLLIKQKFYPLAIFVLVYLTASMFVAHRDISRYTLPVFPFLLIAFEKVLISREFKIAIGILFLAIYLYAQNFILFNTAPIPNLNIYN